ncbi:unnamed protein product [Diatraea saccharalis]|uniref:Chitinase II/V-like catalytic domain-containing protein n=1 Tax=Diatraea saccharalis TaxID=40085 RepID=A0A9P0C6T8_9NEOP|nr:unnamed protein product [Diatraea saccharalis]
MNFITGNYKNFNELKKKSPSLKTLLGVGGWNEGSLKYSEMAASPVLRKNFIQSALQIIRDYDFNGIDIDWLYPNRRNSPHGQADKENFNLLLKEIKEEFNKFGLILVTAVAAHAYAVASSYDVPFIAAHVDYIYLMSYDLAGPWDMVTGHNAPLHKGEGLDESVDRNTLLTVDVAVERWLQAGCPPEKLVLSVPFFGHTFTLRSANENGVRAPVSGAGINRGDIGYNELCNKLHTEHTPSWTERRDTLAKVPYAVRGVEWVSYDDLKSIRDKVAYATSKNLAGVSIWSIDTDDFHDICGAGKFPLLTAINNALNRNTASEEQTE